jgi:hypothetical protein
MGNSLGSTEKAGTTTAARTSATAVWTVAEQNYQLNDEKSFSKIL